jgi:hypothetical protein
MRVIGRRIAEFDDRADAEDYVRLHGREYSLIGGIDKPWGVGKWITLDDEDIRAVVNPKPPGEHAIRNAAQAAMLVESDREHA